MRPRHQDRRCVGTGEPLPPGAAALRFGMDPDGVLTPDPGERLPGRGAWLTPSRALLLKALARGGFARSFRTPARLPDGLTAEAFADRLGVDLWARALAALGLARRAGQVVLGFEKVKAEAPRLVAYLTPVDAAVDGVRKLRRALAVGPDRPHIPLPGDSDTLSQALGDFGVVHVGVLSGQAGARALREVERAATFAPAPIASELYDRAAD